MILVLFYALCTSFKLMFLDITTLKEANLAFLPYESQVYTLDFPEAFENYYCSVYMRKDELFEKMADQLATVCAMLGEYPAIRHWKLVYTAHPSTILQKYFSNYFLLY